MRLFKHRCRFGKPIASMYISFSTRDIIYECKCGKRKIKRTTKSFSDGFPIHTDYGFFNRMEFEDLLSENNEKI